MFGAFQRAVASAADFEEAVNAAAAVMGEDPRRLGLQAHPLAGSGYWEYDDVIWHKRRFVTDWEEVEE